MHLPKAFPQRSLLLSLLAGLTLTAQAAGSAIVSNTAASPAAALPVASATPLKLIRAQGDLASKDVLVTLGRQFTQLQKGPNTQVTGAATVAALDAIGPSAEIATSARGPDALRLTEQALNFTPMAFDGLCVVVHPSNSVSNIGVVQLRKVYKGEIKSWKDLGHAIDKPIGLVANITPRDGVEFALRQAIFNNGIQPVAAVRFYLALDQLEQGIQLDPWAMGVTTCSRVQKSGGKLKALAIESIKPSIDSLRDGSYLLPAGLYAVTRADEARVEIAQLLQMIREPALADPIKRQYLLPVLEADVVIAGEAARKKRIADLINPPPPVVATPTPPPPLTEPVKKKKKKRRSTGGT